MQQSGKLHFLERETSQNFLQSDYFNFGVFFADGHTDKQMIPHIQYKDKTIVYCADLIPTAGHLPLPYVMGYDTRPLLTMPEKSKFLNSAAENNYFLWNG